MMKKIITILLVIAICLTSITPLREVKGKTLRDYKNELAKEEANLAANKRLTASKQNEIDNKRNAIINANNTIAANENKVEASKTKVAESKEQIKIKTEELQDVINVLQYAEMNSSEIYLDYIFAASSISEMMERQAIVTQVANYTQDRLDELHKLIKENEALQVKLADDNVNLNNSISTYEKQVEDLEKYINSLASIGMDYDETIKALKSQINTFEKAGCKDSDDIDACYYSKLNGSASFSRPLNSGVITQAWGNNGHAGMDIGGNPKGTKIYAPANGTVAHVAYKQSCGGNEIYIHHNVGGKAYTSEYGHLTSIYVKDGQYVTKGTVIGTVGGDPSTFYYDKCTTGTHLHYSIAYGYYLGSGVNGYRSWSKFKTNTKATNVQSITNIKNVRRWRWTSRY